MGRRLSPNLKCKLYPEYLYSNIEIVDFRNTRPAPLHKDVKPMKSIVVMFCMGSFEKAEPYNT